MKAFYLAFLCSSLGLSLFFLSGSVQAAEKEPLRVQHAQVKADLGRLYRSLQNYPQALSYFQQASTLDPPEAEYDLEQGWTYFLMQDFVAAQAAYRRAESKIPADQPELHRRLAYYQKLAQNLPVAATELENLLWSADAVTIQPEDYLHLGQIYQLQHKEESARQNYLKAYAAYAEQQRQAPLELAYGLKACQEQHAAQALFESHWQQEPQAETALALASLLYQTEPKRARFYLQAATHLGLDRPLSQLEMAYLWLKLGEPQRSAELYQQVLSQLKQEQDPQVLLSAAQALQASQQPQAVDYYLRVLQDWKQDPEQESLNLQQQNALASGLMHYRHWSEAKQVLQSMPLSEHAVRAVERQLLLAQCEAALGQKVEAKQQYLSLAEMAHELSKEQRYAVIAGLLQAQELTLAKQLLAFQPSDSLDSKLENRLLQAQIAMQEHDLATAHTALQDLVPDETWTVHRLQSLANLHLRLREPQAAERSLDLAFQQTPSPFQETELWILRGQILEQEQASARARRAYLQAQKLVLTRKISLSDVALTTLALGLASTGAATQDIVGLLRQRAEGRDPRLLLTLAQLSAAEEPQQAELWLQAAKVKIAGDDWDTRAFLGATQLKLKHELRAEKTYQDLVAQFPDQRDYRKQWAAAALLHQDWDLAYRQYQLLLATDPQDDESRFNLALLEKQARRRWQSKALLADLHTPQLQALSQELNQEMMKAQILLSPTADFSSDNAFEQRPMIFKGEQLSYLHAQTEQLLDWHSPNPESQAQPDVRTQLALGVDDYFSLNPSEALNWNGFREWHAGVKLDYEHLGRLPVERLYFAPALDYYLTQPEASTPLQHVQLGMTAGLVPTQELGLELRGLVNLGQPNLLLGSFLNYSLEAQVNRFWQDLSLAYTTGLQSYALFDTQARQQDAFRWRNTLSWRWQKQSLNYAGEFDISPIWGTLQDLNLNSQHHLRYALSEDLFAQFGLEEHHYSNPFQLSQSRLNLSAGLRWRLPWPEPMHWGPLYLGADLQENWFYAHEAGWQPGWLLSLRTIL